MFQNTNFLLSLDERFFNPKWYLKNRFGSDAPQDSLLSWGRASENLILIRSLDVILTNERFAAQTRHAPTEKHRTELVQ